MMLSWTKRTILGCALSLTLLLGGCVPPNVIEVSVSVWCDTNHPEQPTRAQYATYSHQQKVDMLDHNTFGSRHCGWKPGN